MAPLQTVFPREFLYKVGSTPPTAASTHPKPCQDQSSRDRTPQNYCRSRSWHWISLRSPGRRHRSYFLPASFAALNHSSIMHSCRGYSQAVSATSLHWLSSWITSTRLLFAVFCDKLSSNVTFWRVCVRFKISIWILRVSCSTQFTYMCYRSRNIIFEQRWSVLFYA